MQRNGILEHRHRIDQIPSQLQLQVITHHDALCWSKKQKYFSHRINQDQICFGLVEDDPLSTKYQVFGQLDSDRSQKGAFLLV